MNKNTKVRIENVLKAILYRLKTGCQWRELPMRQFFSCKYSWKSVFYHFQKWSKDGSFQRIWEKLLRENKSLLDMSSIQLDGTHTPAKRGGEAVTYQGRKKNKTSNMLYITDARGIPIACSEAIEGHHNDAFELIKHSDKMVSHLEKCNITTKGLFLNADAGFDTNEFRQYCDASEIICNIDTNKRNNNHNVAYFDELLYKQRFVIERTNAWLDGFKALLIRFETNKIHWEALNILAFITILLRQL